MCATKMLLLVFMFTTAHFHLFCPLAFLVVSPALQNFHVVLPKNFRFFGFRLSLSLQLQLFLCYPRQCRHENLVQKKKRGFVVSPLFKSLGGHAIYRQHAQGLECEISLRLTGDRRTDGQVNNWGVLDISLDGEVRPGPSYPDPV